MNTNGPMLDISDAASSIFRVLESGITESILTLSIINTVCTYDTVSLAITGE